MMRKLLIQEASSVIPSGPVHILSLSGFQGGMEGWGFILARKTFTCRFQVGLLTVPSGGILIAPNGRLQ